MSFANRDEYACKSESKTTTIVQLYRLAALLYINRALIGTSEESSHYRRLVDKALSRLAKIRIREAPWAFFIIACKAQTEFQRRYVLQLISETPIERRSSNSDWIQRMMESAWNQDDLHVERNVYYMKKMSAVISSCPFVPPFA